MSFWRIGDWTWQTFCYMPITDSISQLIDGESIVFGCLCLCHSVIALSGRFTWNWSKVAVNRVLLNAAGAAWSPVFFTHHVSGVRGPENGSLFFRRIAYVILLWIMSDTTKAVAFGDRYNMNRQCLCCGRRKELEYMYLFIYKLRSVQNTGTCYPGPGWFVRNLGWGR